MKKALAYRQGDFFLVEGWLRLTPDQRETISLENVAEDEVYIYVEFDDPEIKQYTDGYWKFEGLVRDDDFRYAQAVVGGRGAPKDKDLRRVYFEHIGPMNRNGPGLIWFNLSAAAG